MDIISRVPAPCGSSRVFAPCEAADREYLPWAKMVVSMGHVDEYSSSIGC